MKKTVKTRVAAPRPSPVELEMSNVCSTQVIVLCEGGDLQKVEGI